MDAAVPVIQLQPGSGILGLSFGATRHAVHKFFGVPHSSGQSTIGCEADHWPGITAHFRSDGLLRALEFGPKCACMLDGTMISALPFEEAIAFLRELDKEVLSGPDGTLFPNLFMTVCRKRCDSSEGGSFVLDGRDSSDWWAGE